MPCKEHSFPVGSACCNVRGPMLRDLGGKGENFQWPLDIFETWIKLLSNQRDYLKKILNAPMAINAQDL